MTLILIRKEGSAPERAVIDVEHENVAYISNLVQRTLIDKNLKFKIRREYL